MKKLATLVATAALIVGILPAASAFALLPEGTDTTLGTGTAAATGPTSENVRHVGRVGGSTGGHVTVEGDRLYLGSYGTGMRIFDISNPESPSVLGDWFPGPEDQSDPGLRADAVPDATVMDGRHIVAFGGTSRTGSTQRTEFLDVTDPGNIELLHTFTGASDGESHNSDIFDRERLWLPSGGRNNDGFRIFDLEPLLGGDEPEPIFRGNPHTMWSNSPVRERIGSPHPGNPFTHTHDVTIYPDHEILLQPWDWVDQDDDGEPDPTYGARDIVLLAEGGSYLNDAGNTGSVFVIDITDPTDPMVLNRWVKGPQDGHPIRYHHEAQLLDADPSVMFVSDEDLHNGCEAGGVSTVRLSEDLTQATWLADWFNGIGTPAPNCSAHVFSSAGPYVFMGSYNAGLQVIDMSDPENPTRAGQYIAPGANSWGALWHDGYIYVGDFGGRGLDVFQFARPLGAPIDGQPEACRDHRVELEDGEQLVEHTVYMHGTSASGNADAAQDLADGFPSRLFMDAQEPDGSEHKVYGGPNPVVVEGNRDYYANPLLGYWVLGLEREVRVVCAEAVVYAGTTTGRLALQLWADSSLASADGRITTALGTASANEAAPYTVNFGPLDNQAGFQLLVQAVHEAPGSLLFYDSAERPSKLTYVTVEQTG